MFLWNVPVIGTLISLLFQWVRQDSPATFSILTGFILSYIFAKFIINKINGGRRSLHNVYLIAGIIIIAANIIFGIINIAEGANFLINIGFIISGIVLALSSQNES